MNLIFVTEQGSIDLRTELWGGTLSFKDQNDFKVEIELSETDMRYLKNRFKEQKG